MVSKSGKKFICVMITVMVSFLGVSGWAGMVRAANSDLSTLFDEQLQSMLNDQLSGNGLNSTQRIMDALGTVQQQLRDAENIRNRAYNIDLQNSAGYIGNKQVDQQLQLLQQQNRLDQKQSQLNQLQAQLDLKHKSEIVALQNQLDEKNKQLQELQTIKKLKDQIAASDERISELQTQLDITVVTPSAQTRESELIAGINKATETTGGDKAAILTSSRNQNTVKPTVQLPAIITVLPLTPAEIDSIANRAEAEVQSGKAMAGINFNGLLPASGDRFTALVIPGENPRAQFGALLDMLSVREPGNGMKTALTGVSIDRVMMLGDAVERVNAASGTAADLVAVGAPDSIITDSGIKYVIVGAPFYDAIAELQSAFPDITFLQDSEVGTVLNDLL